jgi:hypothetical protein
MQNELEVFFFDVVSKTKGLLNLGKAQTNRFTFNFEV